VKTARTERRFLDDGRSQFSYLSEILVNCPKCSAVGSVMPIDASQEQSRRDSFSPRRFQCSSCNHRSESTSGALTLGRDARDPYLRLPLCLQTRTRHGVLFAFNARHLDWIEAFVAAGLRERRRGDGMANRSIASRLPAWVKAGKNREAVLRAIGRLRRRLVELTQPR
jgi:hypothetical protein